MDQILKARMQLMLNHPFLASAVARFPFVEVDERGWCELLATDGYLIFFNRSRLSRFGLSHLEFMLAHEVLHCVLGHFDRRGLRQPHLWNVAADYAINLMLVELGLVMPPVGLLDPRYRGLPAEKIYEDLVTRVERSAQGGAQSKNAAEKGASPANLEPAHSVSTMSEAKSWASSGSDQRPEKDKAGGFDEHIDPEDWRGADLRDQDYPSEAERNRIRVQLAKPILAELRGRTRGWAVTELEAARSERVPWERLLASFVTGLRSSDFRLWPPNKRHLWRGVYLPSAGAPGPRLLAVAIDTSGSMTNDQIRLVLGELDRLRSVSECSLLVIQCDAEIQSIERSEPFEGSASRRIRGRGGTDFRPVFEWIRGEGARDHGPVDALVYLTDGHGRFPDRQPDFPVLWISFGLAESGFPFGAVIELSKHQDL